MIKLHINHTEVTAAAGTSILEAAALAGVKIPNMCHNGDLEHFTSCMLCVVKDASNGSILPACTAKAAEGMHIITDDEELFLLRQMALELLLSDHVGDCEAPCRIACPAFMNIPLMNRLIAAGNTTLALKVVRENIALPGVLGRICHAPCEKACKRAAIDEAVSVCLLKRFTFDNTTEITAQIPIEQSLQKVAIIGAGPAGLSAAYYLSLKGIKTIIFDRNEKAGGALRYNIPDSKLDKSVLDKEIENILKNGVEIKLGVSVDAEKFDALCKAFDTVVIATGNYESSINTWQVNNDGKHIIIDKTNYQTSIDKVFAIGNANRNGQSAIRSAAQGLEVAYVIEQMFKGGVLRRKRKGFNSSTGKIQEAEFSEYLKDASNSSRQHPETGSGFSEEAARSEAARCMHCDCRKPLTCKLRFYAESYKVSKKRFAYTPRKPLVKNTEHLNIVYEEGKCIKCGICVRMTAKYKETYGFTFIGRGFNVKIGVPFSEKMDRALLETAIKVAEACPTGALAKTKD